MKSDRERSASTGDAELDQAFRAVREAYDGTNADASTTLQRALFQTRARKKTHRLTRWVLLSAAAALVASTAWAGVTGRLVPAVHSMLDVLHDEHATATPSESPPASIAAPARASAPAVPVEPSPPPVARTEEAPATPPVATQEPPPPPPTGARQASRPDGGVSRGGPDIVVPGQQPPPEGTTAPPAPAPSAPDPHAGLFAEAHRIHFTERDPARALVAWDQYLAAAPDGRFAPEARYNRALTLVRLGRRVDAQTELSSFASGRYGDYHRADARTLLDALARDAGTLR